jgi:hypothetical protein
MGRTYTTLWLGKDHLLCVDRIGFNETYKRFYFHDIQAILLRKTKRGTAWSVTLGVLAVSFLALGLAVSNRYYATAVLCFLSGILACVLLGNSWVGPTCVAHLKTAVQTEQLFSWNRLRVARKCLAILRPLIEQAQGTIQPDELKARIQNRIPHQPPAPPPPAGAPAPMPALDSSIVPPSAPPAPPPAQNP